MKIVQMRDYRKNAITSCCLTVALLVTSSMWHTVLTGGRCEMRNVFLLVWLCWYKQLSSVPTSVSISAYLLILQELLNHWLVYVAATDYRHFVDTALIPLWPEVLLKGDGQISTISCVFIFNLIKNERSLYKGCSAWRRFVLCPSPVSLH